MLRRAGKEDHMVKRCFALFFAAALFMTFAAIACAGQAGDDTKARVTYLEGTASVSSAEHPKSTPLRKGDRLGRGQNVNVGAGSRLELHFPEGTVMRFAERSVIKLDELLYRKQDGEKTVKIGLDLGKMWAKVRQLVTPGSRVEVWTANAVAGVRGTVYRVNAEEDRSAVVKVYEGSVSVDGVPRETVKQPAASSPVAVPGPHAVPPPYHEVTMEEWHVIVRSFQQITISPEGKPSEPAVFKPQDEADDWVQWNRERDKSVVF
jgi:hypothetical protein